MRIHIFCLCILFATALQSARAATVETLPTTNILDTSVTLRTGVSGLSGATADVWFAWGGSDEGTNTALWDNTEYADTLLSDGSTYLVVFDTLEPESNYYVRAFITNATSVTWSTNVQSFTTLSGYPTSNPSILYKHLICDTNGNVIWPPDFFGRNLTESNLSAIAGVFTNRGVWVNSYTFLTNKFMGEEWFFDVNAYWDDLSNKRWRNYSVVVSTNGVQVTGNLMYISPETPFGDIPLLPIIEYGVGSAGGVEYSHSGDYTHLFSTTGTTPVIVKSITLYASTISAFSDPSNDFTGITVLVDDATQPLNPVNLRTFQTLVSGSIQTALTAAAVSAGTQSSNAAALWHLYAAPSITMTNGWTITASTNELTIASATTGRVSIAGPLYVSGSLLDPTNLTPPGYAALQSKVDNLTISNDQPAGILLTSGTRPISNLYVAGADSGTEMFVIQNTYYFFNTNNCLFFAPKTVAGWFGQFDGSNITYASQGVGVDEYLYKDQFSTTNFFSAHGFFLSSGRYNLNPGLSGSLTMLTGSVRMVRYVYSESCVFEDATTTVHLVTYPLSSGRLYRVSFDADTVGSSPASISVAFGGQTHSHITPPGFDRVFYVTSPTSVLTIAASTASSALEIDNLRISLLGTNHPLHVAGPAYIYGSTEAGSIASRSTITAMESVTAPVITGALVAAESMTESGQALGERYLSMTQYVAYAASNQAATEAAAQQLAEDLDLASRIIGAGRAYDITSNRNHSTEHNGLLKWNESSWSTTNAGHMSIPPSGAYGGALDWTVYIKYRRLNTNAPAGTAGRLLSISGTTDNYPGFQDHLFYGHGIVLSTPNATNDQLAVRAMNSNLTHEVTVQLNGSRGNTTDTYTVIGTYLASAGRASIWYAQGTSTVAQAQADTGDYAKSAAMTNGIILNSWSNGTFAGASGIEIYEAGYFSRNLGGSEVSNLWKGGLATYPQSNMLWGATFDRIERPTFVTPTGRLVVVDGIIAGYY